MDGLLAGMTAPSVEFGAPLDVDAGEIRALTDAVQRGALPARRVVRQQDGDIRFWDVEPGYNLLRDLVSFATERFRREVGEAPSRALVMVNHIDAATSPN